MIELSPQQKEAVDKIVDWFVACYNGDMTKTEFYMAGYAGVGKTVLAKEVAKVIRKKFPRVYIVSGAYTGKAVDVLRSKGLENVMTIHRMIYLPVIDPETKKVKFVKSNLAPAARSNLLILDEVSMVDKKMAADLRSFRIPMLILGDPAQLPPINGDGFVAGREPDVFLTQIHRQAEGSPILKLATMARNGEFIPSGVYGDKVMVTDDYNEEVLQKYVFSQKRMPICGLNKTRATINRTFRQYMGLGNEPLPVRGERLICCQNDADIGLFNGMMGRVFAPTKAISPAQCDISFEVASGTVERFQSVCRSYTAMFRRNYEPDTKEPEYRRGIQKFDYGYCLTTHKAQGSEWDHVTLIDESGVFREHADKWLYTAITRAADSLVIIRK